MSIAAPLWTDPSSNRRRRAWPFCILAARIALATLGVAAVAGHARVSHADVKVEIEAAIDHERVKADARKVEAARAVEAARLETELAPLEAEAARLKMEAAALKAKVDEGKKKGGDEAAVTTGFLGVADSAQPKLAAIAASELSALDPKDPAAALGLEVSTAWSLFRAVIKKNVAGDGVSGPRGDRAFGRGLLIPSLSNVSLATHLEVRPWVWVRCKVDCSRARDGDGMVTTQISTGGYASAEIGELSAATTQEDGSIVSGRALPFAASVGWMYRRDYAAQFGSPATPRLVSFAGYAGLTTRQIGSDISDRDRLKVLSTKETAFWGLEAGLEARVGSFVLDYRATYLDNYRKHRDLPDPHVPGLTGLQQQFSIWFVLPIDVLGATAPSKDGDDDTSTNEAGNGAASGSDTDATKPAPAPPSPAPLASPTSTTSPTPR